jgi:hypothetical protein
MGVFTPEPEPLFTYETTRQLEETFKQKPTRIPLEVPLYPTYIMKQETNWVPIVAIVGLFGLFAFLGFLAFMRKT